MAEYGVCRFCGQIQQRDYEGLTEAEANERATQGCRCPDAVAYRAKEVQKREAKSNIRILFTEPGEGWETVNDERIISLMESAVDLIAENKLRSVTMNIPGVGTAKISVNAKDGIVTDRRKTDSETLTAGR
jgi:hypothetical protein